MTDQAGATTARGGGSESRRLDAPGIVSEWMDRGAAAVVPLSITAELTQRCNLRCTHCYLQERIRGTTPRAIEMSIARWVDLMGELAAAGTAIVGLTGGELSLRKGWLDVAEAVKSNHMVLGVLTNGTLMSDYDIDRLAELHPVRVSMSLYGADAVSHEAVTGIAGSFGRTLDSIRRLVERGVACRVSSVLLRDGISDVRNVRDLAAELGCQFTCNPTLYPTLDDVHDLSALMPGMEDVKEFYRLMLAEVPDAKSRVTQQDEVAPVAMRNCRAGITGAYIEADGRVLPCPGFLPGFGSVADIDFLSVWHGEAAHRHRQSLAEPLHACDDCGISGFCTSRCPKIPWLQSGSLDGPHEAACKTALALAELRAETKVKAGSR